MLLFICFVHMQMLVGLHVLVEASPDVVDGGHR